MSDQDLQYWKDCAESWAQKFVNETGAAIFMIDLSGNNVEVRPNGKGKKGQGAAAMRAANDRINKEVTELKYDIERYVEINAEIATENAQLENRLNLAFEMLNDHGVDNAAIMKHIRSLMERVSTGRGQ